MRSHVLFLSFWVLNSVILFLFHFIAPDHVALGTHRLTPIEGLIYSGLWMTLLYWIMWDFAISRKIKLETALSGLVFFWLLNSAAVWIVARFAYYTGYGISSFYWAILIGLIALLGQTFVWAGYAEKRKK